MTSKYLNSVVVLLGSLYSPPKKMKPISVGFSYSATQSYSDIEARNRVETEAPNRVEFQMFQEDLYEQYGF